jgi:hypothetical protein
MTARESIQRRRGPNRAWNRAEMARFGVQDRMKDRIGPTIGPTRPDSVTESRSIGVWGQNATFFATVCRDPWGRATDRANLADEVGDGTQFSLPHMSGMDVTELRPDLRADIPSIPSMIYYCVPTIEADLQQEGDRRIDRRRYLGVWCGRCETKRS